MAEFDASLPAAAETVLTFLESVGRRSEAEFYLRLFHKWPKESFGLIAPGKTVLSHALGSLVEQLRFLSELGLYAPIVIGLFDGGNERSQERLIRRLPVAGLQPKAHLFTELDLAQRLVDELNAEQVPVIAFHDTTSVEQRFAALGQLAEKLDSRKLVLLRRNGGLGAAGTARRARASPSRRWW